MAREEVFIIGEAEVAALTEITDFNRLQDYESVIAYSYHSVARQLAQVKMNYRIKKRERHRVWMEEYQRLLEIKWAEEEKGNKKKVTDFYLKNAAACEQRVQTLDRELEGIQYNMECLEGDLQAIMIMRAILPGVQGRVRTLIKAEGETHQRPQGRLPRRNDDYEHEEYEPEDFEEYEEEEDAFDFEEDDDDEWSYEE